MGSEEFTGLPEDEVVSPAEELKVELGSNDLLDRFAVVLVGTSFRFEETLERIRELGLEADLVSNPEAAGGILAEVHVALALRRFREANKAVILNPIDPLHSETDSYRFERIKGNIVAKNKSTGQMVAEYDQLVKFGNDTTALFEVKYAIRSRGRSQPSPYSAEFINPKFEPLKELFPEDKFAYLVVRARKIPRDPERIEQPTVRKENGTLATYLGITQDELKQHAEAMRLRIDLPKSPK